MKVLWWDPPAGLLAPEPVLLGPRVPLIRTHSSDTCTCENPAGHIQLDRAVWKGGTDHTEPKEGKVRPRWVSPGISRACHFQYIMEAPPRRWPTSAVAVTLGDLHSTHPSLIFFAAVVSCSCEILRPWAWGQ